MLEDQIRRFKVGYRISSELLKENLNPESYEGRIALQREEAMGDDPWEGFGFLVRVGVGFLTHPFRTYSMLKEN